MTASDLIDEEAAAVEEEEELDLEGVDLEAAVAEVAEEEAAALEESPPLEASPVPEDDEELGEEGDDVEDSVIKPDEDDGVEGSLRLKRLLSREGDLGEPDFKRLKMDQDDGDIPPAVMVKVKQLMARWGLMQDGVVKHILKHLPMDELDSMATFTPDRHHHTKSACELVARQVSDIQARKLAGGSVIDCVGAFKFRHKVDMATEKTIRGLAHRELRFILDNFNGSKPMDEAIAEAGQHVTQDDDPDYPENVLPESAGPTTYGRFTRLELIDPIADACVFGDANLTFSLRLAKHRSALGHVGRVIATTFEDLPTLRERYKEIDESIATLETHFAEVFHCVDCTKISINPAFEGLQGSFGAVYYNFPHSGAVGGFFDGHPIVNWRHENLMRLFFRALRGFVAPGGSVKVSSNQGATGVRYSYIVSSALQNEFVHAETMPFLEWHLHRYGRSYGDKRDVYKRPDAKNNESYAAQSASGDMVYCFRYEPSGETMKPQEIRVPPTLATLLCCEDGPFRNLGEQAKVNLAKQLHKRFVTEISGVHVG